MVIEKLSHAKFSVISQSEKYKDLYPSFILKHGGNPVLIKSCSDFKEFLFDLRIEEIIEFCEIFKLRYLLFRNLRSIKCNSNIEEIKRLSLKEMVTVNIKYDGKSNYLTINDQDIIFDLLILVDMD